MTRGSVSRGEGLVSACGMRLFLYFPLFWDPRLDRCTEEDGELKEEEESSESLMSSGCVEARWQIAGAGRWKPEKTTDLLYSTLLREMGGTPRFYFLTLSLSLSPPCLWASDASGSGVVERWEDQSGRRPLGEEWWGNGCQKTPKQHMRRVWLWCIFRMMWNIHQWVKSDRQKPTNTLQDITPHLQSHGDILHTPFSPFCIMNANEGLYILLS